MPIAKTRTDKKISSTKVALKKKPWWNYSVKQVIKELKTDELNGLTAKEASTRLKLYGPNELPKEKPFSVTKLFLHQFFSPIVWVLIVALFITIFLGQIIDSFAIGAIIFLNAILGFFQEYKAQLSLEALRKLSAPFSMVIRDGKAQSILSREITVGDLVLLEAGDLVPADGRICYSANLSVQEAALTGESLPIYKTTETLASEHLDLGDRKNMAFMSTAVAGGKGRMIITQTALKTELGAIATLLREAHEEKTPLELKLEFLGKQLVLTCLAIILIIFLFGFFAKSDLLSLILLSLSLAVAAIPEGLPAIMTIALAIGVRRMVARHAIIRKLSSVETLGCTTVICTDKTGTLTENKMVVKKIWADSKIFEVTGVGYEPNGDYLLDNKLIKPDDFPSLMRAVKIGVLCNSASLQKGNEGWKIFGDPTEGALLVAAQKVGLEKKDLEKENQLFKEVPFDADRKRMSIARHTNEGLILFVKGAPDIILERSEKILINNVPTELTQEIKNQVSTSNEKMSRDALRVLAVAYKNMDKEQEINESAENNLIFVGLFGMIDPPRKEVKDAIALCKKAGIKTVMITGDYKGTALAIAKELKLFDENLEVVTGHEVDAMSEKDLNRRVENIGIFARTSAQHKLRIVKAFKMRGEIVAMTGDGVNDAPALKEADIGVAMGISGTQVTKDAADMVITDDNFASIVSAIEEGRGIYNNILKFINYLVSSNVAELLIIFASIFLGFVDKQGNPYIPLLPVHLLWINLVTDGFPAIALSVDPIDERAMTQKPRNPKEPIIPLKFAIELIIISLLIAVSTLLACHIGLASSALRGHTMAFTALVVFEFVRIEMVRTSYNLKFFSNPWLILALLVSFLMQLAVIYIPSLQTIFKTVPLTLVDWGIMISIAFVLWAVSLVVQKIFRQL